MTYTVVVPSIYPTYTERCLASCKLKNVLLVDNTESNRGVAASWNMGIDQMVADGSDWLILMSAAMRFGPAGGLDFVDQLEDQPTLEGGNGIGWHLVAFPRWHLETVGRFDENFWPAYWEDNDYARRGQVLGIDQSWPKADIDADWAGNAHGTRFGHVGCDNVALRAYYSRKHGGPPSSETFTYPFNDESHDMTWWPEGGHPLSLPRPPRSDRLPVLIDVEASLEAVSRQHHLGMVKTVEDVARYERVIEETTPTRLVECGTFSGKSALWFSARVPLVLTIDTGSYVDVETREGWGERVHELVGSSAAPEILDAVGRWTHDRRTMVVLDSDHSATHVRAEMEAYGPLVTPGCYMVVEDGLVRWMENHDGYDGSPLDAIEGFMAVHGDDWERDVAIEQMFPQSQFPAGWLKKR